MKFIAFDVRDDEKPYFQAWAKQNKIEVTLDSGVLDERTLKKLQDMMPY